MQPFDLLGPLPAKRSTTLLEASAGTGKTWTLAAWSPASSPRAPSLDEMLVVTFGRAASQELRERVRDQLVAAERGAPATAVRPLEPTPPRGPRHAATLRDALAGFDAATIATTHQFCRWCSARSVSPATPTPARAGRGPRRAGRRGRRRPLPPRASATRTDRFDPPRRCARARGRRRPADHGSSPRRRADTAPRPGRFAHAVRAELDRRKRRLGILTYDDLLTQLADALETDGAAARGADARSAGRSC